MSTLLPLHKKLSFPFRISSVNVTKSAVSFGSTEEILNGKFHFLCSVPYVVHTTKPFVFGFQIKLPLIITHFLSKPFCFCNPGKPKMHCFLSMSISQHLLTFYEMEKKRFLYQFLLPLSKGKYKILSIVTA